MKRSLITLFLFSILLISSIDAFKVSRTSKRGPLRNGAIIVLKTHNGLKFLDADTATGGVYLRNTMNPGTKFKVHGHKDGSYSFECMGGQRKPQYRFLDGKTQNGKISLAPNTRKPWTGTRWRVKKLCDGKFALRNLGHIKNSNHKFLDNYFTQNRVYLSPRTDGHFEGTHWKIINIANKGGCGCSKGHKKVVVVRKPVVVRRPVVVRKPVVRRPAHHRVSKGLLRNGEVVTFVTHNGQKYLDADTATGGVYLRSARNTGTKFQVYAHKDGSYSFRCMGGQQKPEYRFLDGRTQDGKIGLAPNTNSPWTGTRWRVKKLCDGKYSLESLGHIKNCNHKFLDNYFTQDRVYLSPKTDGHFEGTHWSILKN